ncbi:F-box/FBD/LRR-repeat protein At1g16930-like [Triticum dicoccoides]|uniref:F-box/FBD/LRR-repeat protein At1g16930-like n=1 Tax=Triticum dicoccoides TaxID=85692 RepID=UPI00188F9FD9|nr:F-box/FBD/LRR-repeat protein At1g16930-like [Triticum dicoccoides]
MEAAASAAVAAAKETALAAAAAASAASKEAAAAAAAVTEAAATVKEAAAKASAAALNAKEAAAVATAAGEAAAAAAANVAAATAALQASKKRKFHLVDDQDPPGSGNVDHISRVPDAVLGSIVSLLPTKEGARTQAISRRWRPLWLSSPLNLALDRGPNSKELITKILSEHPGPARRFSVCISQNDDKIEGWLSSPALDNLEEFELTYTFWGNNKDKLCLLPLSVFRFSPTIRVATFYGSHFPNLIAQLSLKFPCLKQLTLERVTISEDVLQGMLSGCPALESLELMKVFGIDRLCISSQTLKSLRFFAGWTSQGLFLHELVIEDAPCLERLLRLDPVGTKSIKIIGGAPKLAILGMLSEDISELHLGSSVFQKMIAVSLTTKMHTMRVLALRSTGPNLDAVVNFLKCFPCLERLYVIFKSWEVINNVRSYDPLDPIESLELHLKNVVLKNYDGTKSSSIDFAKFFVLNAKVLKEMKITLPYHRRHRWFAKQFSLLRVRSRASQDAQIEMRCGSHEYFTHIKRTHDLSTDDPFDLPSIGCSKCKEKGLGDAVYQI